jgi:hypothetical protein
MGLLALWKRSQDAWSMRQEVRALTEVTTAELNEPWTIEERVDLLRSQ